LGIEAEDKFPMQTEQKKFWAYRAVVCDMGSLQLNVLKMSLRLPGSICTHHRKCQYFTVFAY